MSRKNCGMELVFIRLHDYENPILDRNSNSTTLF